MDTLKDNLDINIQFLDFNQTDAIKAITKKFIQENQNINFSHFLRPPPILKRQSGKLLLTAITAIVISGSLCGYFYIKSILINQNTADLTQEYNNLRSTELKISSELVNLENERINIKKIIETETDIAKNYEETLMQIYDKKTKYHIKSVALYELTNLINNRNIKVVQISNTDNNITVSLISQDEKNLTKLMQDINNLSKYAAATKSIDRKNDFYESNITVQLR